MNRIKMTVLVVSAIVLSGCTPAAHNTPTTSGPRWQHAPIVYMTREGGDIPGTPWILVVMTDGTLRDGGIVLDDDSLAPGIQIMHGEMAIVLKVEQPESTTFKSVQAALSRLLGALQRNTRKDAQVTIYLQYIERGEARGR